MVLRGLLPPRAVWPCAFPLFPFTLAFAFGAARRWSRRAGTVAGIGCGGFTVPVRGLGSVEWLGVEALEAVMSGDRDPPLRALRCRHKPGSCKWFMARSWQWDSRWHDWGKVIAPGLYICMKRSDLIRQTKSELDQT
ncbi:hypothetical protein JB92DRAFT_2919746 [Gautieria morchelliformis]|nr:hypothetical protein JB92DRAFT_2919746 [Gautieria morchelliformis]